MDSSTPVPVIQVRVIATLDDARAILADLDTRTRRLAGPDAMYRRHIRPGRRAGQVRGYLTVTRSRREEARDEGRCV